MSALRLQHDLHKLDAQIARVRARAARTGVAASAVGSPLGDALDALAECQRALRAGGFSQDGSPLARAPVVAEEVGPEG